MRYLLQSAAVCALVIASAAVAGSVSAQTKSPTPANAQSPDDIVVTARKTEEKLRDIPGTIQAVSAQALDDVGPVVGTGDLVRTIPGVRFNDLEAPNLAEIAMRGSGTERATGADSAVGLFVNGAYAGSSTLGGRNFKSLDFFDPDRIEILEGPQGALYGRNSEYGTVNVVLAKPKFNTSGYINDSYTGTLDRNQLNAVANFAINDDWAFRIGAQSVGQGKGFYSNPDANKYYDHQDGWIARGQLRYRHGPLDVTLLADAQDMNLPVFVNTYNVGPNVLAALPKGYVGDRFTVPSNGLNDTEQKVQRVMLNGTLDLGWAVVTNTSMVTSSESLQHYGNPFDTNQEAIFQSLGESGAYPFAQVFTRAADRTYYQDLHLDGKTLGGNLKWLTGVEYMLQHDINVLTSTTTPCTLTATSSICAGTPTTPICIKLIPTALACPVTFGAASIFGSINSVPQRYNSAAIYGSLNYTFDRFSIDGELRYTDDKKTATQYVSRLYTNAAVGAPNQYNFKAGKLSYGLTLSYKLPGAFDNLIYAKTGSGYRAGGVNSGVAHAGSPTPFSGTYNDETTTSYEVGFKGNLVSNLYITVDAYSSRTSDAITSVNDGCTVLNVCAAAATQFNINGGTVHATGIEATVATHWRVLDGRLDLSVTGGNQRATYVAVPALAGVPIVNSSVAQTPLWTSSVNLNYVRPLGRGVTGLFNLTYNGQNGGAQDTTTATAPLIGLSSYSNISLRTGVRWQKLEAAIFVKNLNDTTLQLLKFQQTGITYATRYNQPRTIGANIIYHW